MANCLSKASLVTSRNKLSAIQASMPLRFPKYLTALDIVRVNTNVRW